MIHPTYILKISLAAMWGKSRRNKGEAGRLDRKLVSALASALAEADHRQRGAGPCSVVGS